MRSVWWCGLLVVVILGSSTGTARAARQGIPDRPATSTRPTTTSPRSSATPTQTAHPTASPIQRCGQGYCVVITPTATAIGGAAPGAERAFDRGRPRCDLLDPGTWLPCFIAAGIDLVTGWVRTIVNTQMFADVWGSTNVLLTVENPVVVRYHTAIRLASDLLLALFAMGVFGEILVCQRAHQTYHHAVEKIWRLVLIAFLSNMSLAVIAQAVDLSNIMTGGVWSVQSSGLDAVMAHTDPGSAVVVASIFALANEIMLLLLFVQMVMRLALLDVLIVLAPLGLLCYGWGPTQEWGQLWRQHFTATLVVQFVQVVALVLGEDLWTYAPYVFAPDGTTITGETSLLDMRGNMELAIALGVFAVVLLIPRLLRARTGNSSFLGVALGVRVLLGRGR